VAVLPGVPTHLDKLNLSAHLDPAALRDQFKVRRSGELGVVQWNGLC
jgi:hypothetical protein